MELNDFRKLIAALATRDDLTDEEWLDVFQDAELSMLKLRVMRKRQAATWDKHDA